jgi:hypothetical protein
VQRRDRVPGVNPRQLLFLFAIGAAGGLVGDGANVQSGLTEYFDKAGPHIWKSAWWFPILVGLGTVATAVTRLQLGPPRGETDFRIGVGAFAAVTGIYAISSVAGNDGIATVALCASIAVILACFVGDRYGVICGLIAALIGPAFEIAIVNMDLSAYSAANDGLFGVALWLPPLYFAFGIAVARITELLVARRQAT